MISEGLRKHAFWLYGVILGLSIKTALDIVGPHLIDPPHSSYKDGGFETSRLCTFLLISIQYYLGSVRFFDQYYEARPNLIPEESQGYALDYLFGLAHFILFFGWSISIDTHRGHLRLFPVLMVLVLTYHVLWSWGSRGRATYAEIRMRAWLNFGMVIFAVAVYSVSYLFLGAVAETISSPTKHRIAEAIALAPLILISITEIVGVMRDKQLLAAAVLSRIKT